MSSLHHLQEFLKLDSFYSALIMLMMKVSASIQQSIKNNNSIPNYISLFRK